MASYTIKNLPPGLWIRFKHRTLGDFRYKTLNSKLLDLIAIDQAVFEATDHRTLQTILDQSSLIQDEIDAQYTRDPPEGIDPDDVADAYTVTDAPDGLWTFFKNRSQGDSSVQSISETLVRLLAVDQTLADQLDEGLFDYVISKGIIEESDITAALEKEPPEQRPYK